MSRIPCPKPGVYRGVPMETYRRWNAVANSDLTYMLRSPAHFIANLNAPPEPPSEALLIGTAVHDSVLEPDTFDERYLVSGSCKAVQGNGKVCGCSGKTWDGTTWLCGKHDKGVEAIDHGATVLSEYQGLQVERVSESVFQHPTVAGLLAHTKTENREICIVWDDPFTGIRCKMRGDGIIPDITIEGDQGPEHGIAWDLKSTNDAGAYAFSKSIADHGYHRQAWFHSSGYKSAGMQCDVWYNVAVEKTEPYGVAVYRLAPSAIHAGKTEVQALLAKLEVCRETEKFPCYPTEPQLITLPDWALKQSDIKSERLFHEQ